MANNSCVEYNIFIHFSHGRKKDKQEYEKVESGESKFFNNEVRNKIDINW